MTGAVPAVGGVADAVAAGGTPRAASAVSGASPGSPEPGFYNPRPTSPAPARLILNPGAAADDGTPRVEATLDVLEGGASSLSSVATLCNSAVGAGVLSLPYAFACAGLLGGLVLCLVVAAAESFSLFVISKFAERYSAHSYGSLIRRALGRKLSSTLSATMLLYLTGSCIAYLVIVGDTFSSLAQQAFGLNTYTERHAVLLAVGLVVILPMCFAKSLSALGELIFIGWVGCAGWVGGGEWGGLGWKQSTGLSLHCGRPRQVTIIPTLRCNQSGSVLEP